MNRSRRMLGAVAAAAMSTSVLIACSSGADRTSDLVPADHKAQVLARGSVGGKPWVLTVSSSGNGNLCMAINDSLSERYLHTHDAFAEAGCGFGPPDERMSAPFDETTAGGNRLMWGPAPATAVRVRLDTYREAARPASDPNALSTPGCAPSSPAHLWVTVDHALPKWAERGGWFVTHADADGCGYLDATFFDRHNHKIAEHYW
jgi:hypothetical protein